MIKSIPYLYLAVNIGAISIPFLYSFHKKLQFNKKWSAFFLANFISALLFIVWDIYFTEWGIWGFNSDYLLGVNIFNLPFEEVLFFICIPYACVFTFHCFQSLLNNNFKNAQARPISIILLILSGLLMLLNFDKAYTFSAFLSLFVMIAINMIQKTKWMGLFYFTYLILLIPFTIVNGILTGTGIENEIVWYNDAENLNMRYLTIPFEDIFYGMALILLNVSLFEYFKKKLKLG